MECEIQKLSYLLAFIVHRRSMGIRMSSDEKLRFIFCLFKYMHQILDCHRQIYYEDSQCDEIIRVKRIENPNQSNKKLDKFIF